MIKYGKTKDELKKKPFSLRPEFRWNAGGPGLTVLENKNVSDLQSLHLWVKDSQSKRRLSDKGQITGRPFVKTSEGLKEVPSTSS